MSEDRPLSVGALALAADRANAVGAVRLTCAREGLTIELLRVASFAASFAPAAVVEEVSFTVPYVAVRGLVRRGRLLFLALDPAVATPYNRFALARFSDDPRAELLGAYASRARAVVASIVLPPLVGVAAAAMAPETLVAGALGRASVALLAAAVTWLLLRELVAWISWGGPSSDAYRDALEIELSRRMGLSPAPVAVEVPLEELDAPPPAEPRQGKRVALAIAGVTVAVCASLFVLDRWGSSSQDNRPRDVALAAAGLGRAFATAAAPPASTPSSAEPTEPCLCERAASRLWKDGMPVLSVLTSSRKDGSTEVSPVPDARGVMRWDFDVAVVNNSAKPERDVKIVVTFARRDAAGRRVGVRERGLFWEGDLAPGRAVKWRVRGHGTEMRIDADERGRIGPNRPPAPADAFADLARTARYRVVRLHAAKMLAYLADPRAAELLMSVGVEGTADEAIAAAIRRAGAPVIACDIGADGPDAVRACLFNASTSEARVAAVRDPDASRSWPLDKTIRVHEGIRVRLDREPTAPVPAELVVD